jgi:hypothetical protein
MVEEARKDSRTQRGSGLSISALIDKAGRITHMCILSLAFPSVANTVALNEQAIDDVKKWQYKPTMFKGEPVEVSTVIDVIIDLQ